MELRSLLAEVDPSWFDARAAGDASTGALLARARESRLGRRLLARWLLEGPATGLLAPTADAGTAAVAMARQWPRARLQRLCRDLGTLAHAPAIRAEVRREPVRRLKQALGNGYLLALDPSVWDSKVPAATAKRLNGELADALAADDQAALFALLDRQGRSELRAWASGHQRALAEWTGLLHPREDTVHTHLPDAAVRLLYDHHAAQAQTPS